MTDNNVERIYSNTIDCFGEDFGKRLINNSAIVPVDGRKAPARGIHNYNAGVDLSKPFGEYVGLAIVNGPLSNVLAVDLDTYDIKPPVSFNVQTTKGGHIYLPWKGERRKTNFAPGVDILGAGGYSIFWGPGKEFVSPALADTMIVSDWLTTLTPNSMKSLLDEGVRRESKEGVLGESVSRECIATPYPEKVRNHGYELRLETISKTYVTQMRNTKEGSRSDRLYISACQLYRCGIDVGPLMQAAYEAGLPWSDIVNTVGSAEGRIEHEYDPAHEILERVLRWLDAHQNLPASMSAVAMHLAYEAVAVNSTRPQLSQSRVAVDIGKSQGYVSTLLRVMETRYKAVICHAPAGTWGGGLSHCNNYGLTVDGVCI